MNVPDVMEDDKINKRLRKQIAEEKARKKLKPLPGSAGYNSMNDKPERKHTMSLRKQRELDMNGDIKYQSAYVPVNPFKKGDNNDDYDDNDIDNKELDLDVNLPKRKKSYFE